MDINHSFLPHSDSIDFNVGFGNENVHGGGTINLPSGDIHNVFGGVLTPICGLGVSHDFQHDLTRVNLSGTDGSAWVNIPDNGHPPSFGAGLHFDL